MSERELPQFWGNASLPPHEMAGSSLVFPWAASPSDGTSRHSAKDSPPRLRQSEIFTQLWPTGRFSGLSRRANRPGVYAGDQIADRLKPVLTGFSIIGVSQTGFDMGCVEL